MKPVIYLMLPYMLYIMFKAKMLKAKMLSYYLGKIHSPHKFSCQLMLYLFLLMLIFKKKILFLKAHLLKLNTKGTAKNLQIKHMTQCVWMGLVTKAIKNTVCKLINKTSTIIEQYIIAFIIA